MKCFSLNGEWLYRIGKGAQTKVSVPFSRLPVGHSECVRYFDAPEDTGRVFIKFDGITYYARVFLNGAELGEMLPYCEYEFEVTNTLKKHANELRVELEDLDRAFGPSEGWENFGGIIRDVSLILRGESYIKDVFFKSYQTDGGAEFEVEAVTERADGALLEISLFKGEERACSYTQENGEARRALLNEVSPWSPDSPTLYRLEVALVRNGNTEDIYTCNVGFRFLSHDKHKFYLNGKPLFLRGVCKHEMVNDSGHCPTLAQMESDMRMIKEMGCNFVRLVHYPHNKRILDIADRIGLLVSEEPGLWWSDTSVSEIAEGAQEVLRRTVLRDRNHASIAFWLCFNECRFTERFLIESAEICRKYDPTRMVSGANCMTDEETLVYYNKCGFDFYTMHPYHNTFSRAKKSASVLCDKPLVFTEWGGYYVYDNPHLLTDFLTEMKKLYYRGSDEGALAGAFFWFFAELNDFDRGGPACIDGVLREGLVTRDRKPTLIYDAFCKAMKEFDREEPDAHERFWLERAEGFTPLDELRPLVSEPCSLESELVERANADSLLYKGLRRRRIVCGPILGKHSDASLLSPVPYTVTPDKPLVFEYNASAKTLTLIGLVSLIGGYPLGGAYGEEVCKLSITYKDGKKETHSLQNGIHFTTVYSLHASSRIDPVAQSAKRFATFGYDKNFEIYVLNRADIGLSDHAEITRVEFTTDTDRYLPMIYGAYISV